jgi:ABC-type multidrug transport system fused ATPase/permease subunit
LGLDAGVEQKGKQGHDIQISDAKLQEVLKMSSLDDVNLEDKASRLSGGQVQLLAIAQAMLNQNDASILLLDEPTSHLDGRSQQTVLENLFRVASERNQTVLMVAHRLDTAVTFCDQVLVLDQGSLAQFDHPLNLLVNDASDTEINKADSIFADMVKALAPSQQQKILQSCKDK